MSVLVVYFKVYFCKLKMNFKIYFYKLEMFQFSPKKYKICILFSTLKVHGLEYTFYTYTYTGVYLKK